MANTDKQHQPRGTQVVSKNRPDTVTVLHTKSIADMSCENRLPPL